MIFVCVRFGVGVVVLVWVKVGDSSVVVVVVMVNCRMFFMVGFD